MSFFRKRRILKIESQVLELESELEATKRKLQVAEAEIESMAFVIARDRARIEAETAAYNRRKAECEGLTSDDNISNSESPVQLRA